METVCVFTQRSFSIFIGMNFKNLCYNVDKIIIGKI